MHSITNQTNKELEDFIKGDYISITEGIKVLEFDMNNVRRATGLTFMVAQDSNVRFVVEREV